MDQQREVDVEREVLRKEFQWLLSEEVASVVLDIQALVAESCKCFTSNFYTEHESRGKAEKFLLSSANVTQQVKCMVTLLGDVIYEADLALKLQKQQMVPHQTRIYREQPWKLQQIRDAGNHLLLALTNMEDATESPNYRSGQQVLNLLDAVMDGVRRARDALMLPRRRTLEDLVKNPYLKSFKPALPSDAVVSFYIQAQKLVLSVYHLCTNQSNKVDIAVRYQLEATVPWLNNALMLITVVLQKCQQLKDKITVFMQYEDELRLLDLRPSDSNETMPEFYNAEPNKKKKKKSNNPFLDSPDDDAVDSRLKSDEMSLENFKAEDTWM